MSKFKILTVIYVSVLLQQENATAKETDVVYGLDVSFPTHKSSVSTNYAWLPHNVDPVNNPVPEEYKDMPLQPLGDREKFYDDFLEGCRQFYKNRPDACDETEKDRVLMSLRQPQSMQNYTALGFKKIRAPDELYRLLKEHWDRNNMNRKQEKWSVGNTYTNHWKAPTYMVSVEDTSLRGGGSALKDQIWNAARETVEEWTGQELRPSSLYGIRIYTENAVLSPHVDRLPLVSSCIVNVAQDVDEDWPLEVLGHDGKSYNVTMKPGDMVLYESHAIVHARPFPLQGRYFANTFIHFEPVGHSLRHNVDIAEDVDEQYRRAVKNAVGGHENEINGIPSYIIPDSPEAVRWERNHPGQTPSLAAVDIPPAHQAAQIGDLRSLQKIASKKLNDLHLKDENGWQPIHEGCRGGHKDVVKLLVEHGANVNERTNHGIGGTPLWWAKESHHDDHPVVMYLESLGALNIGPEL